ncbi:MAG: hypothetical protein ACHQ53_06285 [Polyangiales bacterium]
MTVPTWRRLPFVRAGLLAASLLFGCGADGRYVLIGTSHAPNASGTVEVDALGGESTEVSVHLEFLHAPNRVSEQMTGYVVWFVPDHGAAVFGGVLKYNAEQRTGDLQATSPFRHFTVKITAESSAHPNAPSENAIATQEVKLK